MQVRRLLFEFRRYRSAKEVAKYAGSFVVDDNSDGSKDKELSGQFVKVRIQLDTTKPVVQGLFLRKSNRNPVWISFKYERLANICYFCASLSHESRTCKDRNDKKEKVFGSRLRAEDSTEHISAWSEEQEEYNEFMVVSLPDAREHPPAGMDTESTQRMPDTSSNSGLIMDKPRNMVS